VSRPSTPRRSSIGLLLLERLRYPRRADDCPEA
jgi:hypothetical protein